MPQSARKTDAHTCPSFTGNTPHEGGPISSPCSPDVDIENQRASRGSKEKTCDFALCKTGEPDFIAEGAGTVLINNMHATRAGDRTTHGGIIMGHANTVEMGGPKVRFRAVSGAGSDTQENAAQQEADGEQESAGGNKTGSSATSSGDDPARERRGECYAQFVLEGDVYLGDPKFVGRWRSPFRFRCTSWDPDTGGSESAPNPEAMTNRKWSIECPDGTVEDLTEDDGNVTWTPRLFAKGPWPAQVEAQQILVTIEVTDAQGHWSKLSREVPILRSNPLRFALFFGGGGDEWIEPNVKGTYQGFGFPDVWYFPWDNEQEALDFIEELREQTDDVAVSLIGHSYGGDTAWDVAHATDADVRHLVTVDAASQFRPNSDAMMFPASVRAWINIYLRERSSLPSAIADIGGDWGNVAAASNYEIPESSGLSHANFRNMFEFYGTEVVVHNGLWNGTNPN
jgi:uncharacterized Zn-binding protein involved in type VI secretion/pimeloyl-ACP methyl ester carboxylesterase